MSEEDSAAADQFLAGLDFAKLSAEQQARHRRELEVLFLDLLEVADALNALARHTADLVQQGRDEVPHRSVALIGRKLRQALARSGVRPMEAAGKPLDLDRHEVVEVRPSSSGDEDRVIEETIEGYLWNDKTLRRARMVVTGRRKDGAKRDAANAAGGPS